MKIVKAKYEILTPLEGENGIQMLKDIERAGRTCYKSEDKITDESCTQFVKMILGRGHESVIEHRGFSVLFTNDRGVSHEEVRQRLASFSQESTRYINYTKENKGGQCTYIDLKQHLKNPAVSFDIWFNHMQVCEDAYKAMIDAGEEPQIARSVLPNSLKTEIVITANLREWRTIFKQRTTKAAHPQMREVMNPLLEELKNKLPVIFDDIIPYYE
jgi:thymidylate synthase (FAD)